jgi:hypothetical protein
MIFVKIKTLYKISFKLGLNLLVKTSILYKSTHLGASDILKI